MSLFAFQQQFPDEASCLAFMETQRWGENGANRYCPHCGSLKSYRFADGTLFKCGDCRKKFTVKVGTMFSDSHVPLHKWFYAISLNTSLKKGMSSIQLARVSGYHPKERLVHAPTHPLQCRKSRTR